MLNDAQLELAHERERIVGSANDATIVNALDMALAHLSSALGEIERLWDRVRELERGR